MKVTPTPIYGSVVIEPDVYRDERGYFMECFNEKKYQEAGLPSHFVQDNLSHSCKGVLRGLHYQWPNPQGKLVQVIAGEVWDVAVDAREGSPTFGQWYGLTLTALDHKQFWIPEGCLHGFIVISDQATFAYKTSNIYLPEFDRGVRYDDPFFAIEWPEVGELILSPKDQNLPLWQDLPSEARPSI